MTTAASGDTRSDASEPDPAEVCELIVTGTPAELPGIVRELVTSRLAACGQQIMSIHSIYRWDGAVEEGDEARVALHTRRSLIPEVIERVKAMHSYDVPCILVLPVVGGLPAYLEWVLAETA